MTISSTVNFSPDGLLDIPPVVDVVHVLWENWPCKVTRRQQDTEPSRRKPKGKVGTDVVGQKTVTSLPTNQ